MMKKYIIPILMLLLLIPMAISYEVDAGEYGIVKIEEQHWYSGLFKFQPEEIFPASANSIVVNTPATFFVTLDANSIPSGVTVGDTVIGFKKVESGFTTTTAKEFTIYDFKGMISSSSNKNIKITFTPQQIGDFRAFQWVKDSKGSFFLTFSQDFTVKQTLLSGDPTTFCPKSDYYTDWIVLRSIADAKIYGREFHDFDSSCNDNVKTEQKIECNSGFVIEGTTTTTSTDLTKKCVAPPEDAKEDITTVEEKTETTSEEGGDGISSPKDSDGDGIADSFDVCPLVKGKISNDGCPGEAKEDFLDKYSKTEIIYFVIIGMLIIGLISYLIMRRR